MDEVRERFSMKRFLGEYLQNENLVYRQRSIGKTADNLKAIHIHYPISSATITSSPRHFQVDLRHFRLY